MILVDTCIWSLALRRSRKDLNPEERRLTFALRNLIIEGQAFLIGPIRQELLSGISSTSAYALLHAQIEPQPDLPLVPTIWPLAAEFFNTCRAAGIAPDAIDMTICAAAHIHNSPIFTTDPDFTHYAKHLPVSLHKL